MTFTIDEYVRARSARRARRRDLRRRDRRAQRRRGGNPRHGRACDVAGDDPALLRRQPSPDPPALRRAGRRRGRRAAVVGWPTTEGATEARLNVEVLPEHRGRGIGSALLERCGDVRRRGRPYVLQSDQMHTASPGGRRLASPTGFGDVPADDPGVRFFVRHGYALEMVARISSLDPHGRAGRSSPAAAGRRSTPAPTTASSTWTGRTPGRQARGPRGAQDRDEHRRADGRHGDRRPSGHGRRRARPR